VLYASRVEPCADGYRGRLIYHIGRVRVPPVVVKDPSDIA